MWTGVKAVICQWGTILLSLYGVATVGKDPSPITTLTYHKGLPTMADKKNFAIAYNMAKKAGPKKMAEGGCTGCEAGCPGCSPKASSGTGSLDLVGRIMSAKGYSKGSAGKEEPVADFEADDFDASEGEETGVEPETAASSGDEIGDPKEEARENDDMVLRIMRSRSKKG